MYVLVLHLPGKRIHYPIPGDLNECSAGSHPDNEIHLPYRGVSRHHFRLWKKQDRWWISDSKSKNGTYLNDRKIKTSPLKAGDRIRAGAVRLTVKISDRDHPVYHPIARPAGATYDEINTERLAISGEKTDPDVSPYRNLVFPKKMIHGGSKVMREIYRRLDETVRSSANVLLIGETGVGKEMIARTIHLSSDRKGGPFIAVNCAAIPRDLAESELFGIGERVATAVDKREGYLAASDGGTLFLDEVSAFPPLLQAKLLRALEERTISPVGTRQEREVDFRLVTATNRDPEELMKEHRMREDFYHRISTIEFLVPPLRERREDIEHLVLALLEQICAEERKVLAGIGDQVLQHLKEYDYPGNVRELLNILRSMVVLAYPGEILNENHLPQKLLEENPREELEALVEETLASKEVNYHRIMNAVSEKLIRHALSETGGKITQAAELLGLSPYGLRKAIKRLKIKT